MAGPKTTKLVRGKEIAWDYTLGGPIAEVPAQEGVQGYVEPVKATKAAAVIPATEAPTEAPQDTS